MIESPPTVSPQRVTLISASNLSTHCTKFRRRAGVQALAVDDRHLAHESAFDDGRRRAIFFLAHLARGYYFPVILCWRP